MTDALVWAVKTSFVDYVEALGEIEVIAPATREDDGAFRFPAAADRDGYRGSVAFRAHHGAMDVVFRDPRVTASELSVEYDDHGREQGRIVVADIADGNAVLAATGAVVFDFTYPIGTALAPIISGR
ncbi:hypothetical protein GCM10009808_24820 [Microbacterium sediminicola]|uniref:Htaa domain-containing protein n=1 Tax=Microbacterium sediminicola TaxID=415210 RepID=A0ABN2IIU1_9MICO